MSLTRALTTATTVVGLMAGLGSCGGGATTLAPHEPAIGAATATGTVLSITDGDTLRLDLEGSELRVRLTGIDTPEVYPEVECFGPEAEQLLRELAPVGSTLRVEYDLDPRDAYDRELLYLYTADGTFVNLEIVARGAAEAVLFEPNDRYWDQLRAAEQAARDARLGLWGQC